jgi:hypothetical protein
MLNEQLVAYALLGAWVGRDLAQHKKAGRCRPFLILYPELRVKIQS